MPGLRTSLSSLLALLACNSEPSTSTQAMTEPTSTTTIADPATSTSSTTSDAETTPMSSSNGGNDYVPCPEQGSANTQCTPSSNEQTRCADCEGTADCLMLFRPEQDEYGGERCAPPCEVVSDCPDYLQAEGDCGTQIQCLPIQTGGTEGTGGEGGTCVMPCSDDEGCPTGMGCFFSAYVGVSVCLQMVCDAPGATMSST